MVRVAGCFKSEQLAGHLGWKRHVTAFEAATSNWRVFPSYQDGMSKSLHEADPSRASIESRPGKTMRKKPPSAPNPLKFPICCCKIVENLVAQGVLLSLPCLALRHTAHRELTPAQGQTFALEVPPSSLLKALRLGLARRTRHRRNEPPGAKKGHAERRRQILRIGRATHRRQPCVRLQHRLTKQLPFSSVAFIMFYEVIFDDDDKQRDFLCVSRRARYTRPRSCR
jgi:hypothetical protein